MTIDPNHIPVLLRQAGIRPKKSLGQNFLIDPHSLQKVTLAAGIAAGENILEIGAGLGNLTVHLCREAGHVIAVEIDQRLIPLLREQLSGVENVTIIHGDILEIDPASLNLAPGYVVVANIPYYITSAILRHLLEAAVKPARMVLTVQKEVAQRVTAAPGELSLLALSVQVYGKPRIVAHIPAACFYPAPDVDSVMLQVDLYPQPLIAAQHLDDFFHVIRAAFSQKRKTLRNALSSGLALPTNETAAWLQAADIDPMRRAETVSLPEWSRLIMSYSSMMPRRKS
ncbi:MAG: ribosomal RNA small subunit methyltransferase A [Anaerolineae bacterium]|jgi:16S rRNA (adenine1518-N6/adenine1519-N6)-dimethyltransferase|nr:ribosomal RNA small subunit methyltransferase A [Anaerolineae bacterium]